VPARIDDHRCLGLLVEAANATSRKLGLEALEIYAGLGETASVRAHAGRISRLAIGRGGLAGVRVWLDGRCGAASGTLELSLAKGLAGRVLDLAAEARDLARVAGRPYPVRPADPWPGGTPSDERPDSRPVAVNEATAGQPQVGEATAGQPQVGEATAGTRDMAVRKALELEATASGPGYRVLECQCDADLETIFLVNTSGLALSRARGSVSLLCHLVGEGGRPGLGRARGLWSSPPAAEAVTAAAREAARFSPETVRLEARPRPVVLSRRVASTLALAMARRLRLGVVPDPRGRRLGGPPGLRLTDDPGLGLPDGQPWDAEGCQTARLVLIEDGRAVGVLADLELADLYGAGLSRRGGNARRDSAQDPVRADAAAVVLEAPAVGIPEEAVFVADAPGLAAALGLGRFSVPVRVYLGGWDGPLVEGAVLSGTLEELWQRMSGAVSPPGEVTVPASAVTPDLLALDVTVGSP
jgi:predicted Zn-dependent protease